MNFLHIAGNLGSDPEVRFTSSGKKVTTFRIATHSRKGQNDVTIWYRVTIWGEQYDKLVSYLKKGSGVIVSGELQAPAIFNDREGKPQVSLDVVASHIQFSPFGKPSSSSSSSPSNSSMNQEGFSEKSSYGSHSSFGSTGFQDPFSSVSSYSPNFGEGTKKEFDDEVPF